jgi:hypothetical protein
MGAHSIAKKVRRFQGKRNMLKSIDPILNADVLYALRAMGHGDDLELVWAACWRISSPHRD